MDEATRAEIIRLFNAPHHRPFKDIDKALGLPEGTARSFLVKEKLFTLETFDLSSNYRRGLNTRKKPK
jgi:hypothetical protein